MVIGSRRAAAQVHQWFLGGECIKYGDCYKYLGLEFTKSLTQGNWNIMLATRKDQSSEPAVAYFDLYFIYFLLFLKIIKIKF